MKNQKRGFNRTHSHFTNAAGDIYKMSEIQISGSTDTKPAFSFAQPRPPSNFIEVGNMAIIRGTAFDGAYPVILKHIDDKGYLGAIYLQFPSALDLKNTLIYYKGNYMITKDFENIGTIENLNAISGGTKGDAVSIENLNANPATTSGGTNGDAGSTKSDDDDEDESPKVLFMPKPVGIAVITIVGLGIIFGILKLTKVI